MKTIVKYTGLVLFICLIAKLIEGGDMNQLDNTPENWSFGDIGKQGSSYRILVHAHEDYNKARWINTRGENTTVLLNDVKDASQYATGNHPANKYCAPIYRIATLSDVLPVVESDVVDTNYGSKIIKILSNELTKLGPDKNLHFLASYTLISMVDPSSSDTIEQIMECFVLSLGKGIEKEVTDKGLSLDDPKVIELQKTLDETKNILIKLAKQMQDLGLDEGDLLADLVGVYAGTAVKTVREFNFKYGKVD